jgi:hypothetical protein
MDGSAREQHRSSGNGRVIELVDQHARDLASAAMVKSAVTTDDLRRTEALIIERVRRVELLQWVTVGLLAVAIGLGLAAVFLVR